MTHATTRRTLIGSLPARPIPVASLPAEGYVRIDVVTRIIPVAPRTIWHWVAAGRFPRPIKLGDNVTAWRVEDLRRFLATAGTGGEVQR